MRAPCYVDEKKQEHKKSSIQEYWQRGVFGYADLVVVSSYFARL
jgi:hypothetical protein